MNLQDYITAKVDECYIRAEAIFKRKFVRPKVLIKAPRNKRHLAVAIGGKNEIWLRPDTLQLNPTDLVADTIPHEICHLLVDAVYGASVASHGFEWKNMMKEVFGLKNPKATSSASYKSIGLRDPKKVVYKCKCREHFISDKSHSRLLAGNKATCVHCGVEVQYVTELD